MSGQRIQLKGWRVTKEGKLVRDVKRLDVSAQLRMRASKRVRVQRGKVTT